MSHPARRQTPCPDVPMGSNRLSDEIRAGFLETLPAPTRRMMGVENRGVGIEPAPSGARLFSKRPRNETQKKGRDLRHGPRQRRPPPGYPGGGGFAQLSACASDFAAPRGSR
jgi:hypothetical protein